MTQSDHDVRNDAVVEDDQVGALFRAHDACEAFQDQECLREIFKDIRKQNPAEKRRARS